MSVKRIRRMVEETDARQWFLWTCEVCGKEARYLNEDAMRRGSIDHRNAHRNDK